MTAFSAESIVRPDPHALLLLLAAPKNNGAGSRAFDSVIGASAEQAQVSAVLTFNAGDFAALDQDYDIVVPGTG